MFIRLCTLNFKNPTMVLERIFTYKTEQESVSVMLQFD